MILARKDAPASYHLAVTLDDAAQGITHVVRGTDLFPATHVHRLLQALLGLPTPEYRHHPLLLGPDGTRLAKRHGAPSLEAMRLGARTGARSPIGSVGACFRLDSRRQRRRAGGMTFFLAALLIAAMLAVVFVLIKGLVNMAQTTTKDLEGEGPSDRALKSNKLMQQRILLQGVAIAIIALLLLILSAKG